ncbi:hypothetical protein LZ575_02465 [Antarcticibacterium sp. 1MA-6-2]|nr:hypothetical protein [Antarcticibacterium sp. 1MA-6-2]UJH91595.1 hypothetical protein LZ575_02465 [Antarcticibacterium sp. 1MA-6-2]
METRHFTNMMKKILLILIFVSSSFSVLQAQTPEERLQELGIELPEVKKP